MDASEAREHLEMVERIISASSRKLECGGEYFIVWGLAAAIIDIVLYLIFSGRLPLAAMWALLPIDIAAVVFSIVRGRYYRRRGSLSFLQREFFNVLWLAFAMAFVVDVIGVQLFTGWAQAAIWSIASALVLFYIAVHGNRRAMAGAILILCSIAVANFEPQIAGLALAAGMLFGYAGFGVADLLARA